MSVAQTLYEGVELDKGVEGLITYMRTDSTRVAKEANNALRGFIKKKFGTDYLMTKRAISARIVAPRTRTRPLGPPTSAGDRKRSKVI